jgi:hypothetical protein
MRLLRELLLTPQFTVPIEFRHARTVEKEEVLSQGLVRRFGELLC